MGNVKVVFNDYKEPVSGGSGSEKYDLNVLSLLNYYPFGMSMPGMGYEAGVSRYGFGGHEQDDEVSGVGNHVSFGNQGYSPRLGKRWNQDKVEHIDFSPYVTFANDPVNKADLDGNQETRAGIMLRQAEESYLKTGDRKQMDDLYTGNAVGAVMGVIAIALPETIPLMLRNPVRTVSAVNAVGNFAVGLVDEGNQINLPGQIAGRATKGIVKKVIKKAKEKVTNVSDDGFGINLNKKLASEEQMGKGKRFITGTKEQTGKTKDEIFNDANKASKNYGGKSSDYQKKSSKSYKAKDGTVFETHWIENTKTGQKNEFKTKILKSKRTIKKDL